MRSSHNPGPPSPDHDFNPLTSYGLAYSGPRQSAPIRMNHNNHAPGSQLRSHSQDSFSVSPIVDYPSRQWVVGTITRKLHGCLIVNHDVFVHKSVYAGLPDPAYSEPGAAARAWFHSLSDGDQVEVQVEKHIQGRNKWRATKVRGVTSLPRIHSQMSIGHTPFPAPIARSASVDHYPSQPRTTGLGIFDEGEFTQTHPWVMDMFTQEPPAEAGPLHQGPYFKASSSPICAHGSACPIKRAGCVRNHPSTPMCRHQGLCSHSRCPYNHPPTWVIDAVDRLSSWPSESPPSPPLGPAPRAFHPPAPIGHHRKYASSEDLWGGLGALSLYDSDPIPPPEPPRRLSLYDSDPLPPPDSPQARGQSRALWM